MTQGRRQVGAQKRLLGDARRETVEAAHIALAKRRRLAADNDDEDVPSDDDQLDSVGRSKTAAVASGALGDDDAAIFADAIHDEEDAEADVIYNLVDERMQSRRKRQRELMIERQLRDYREANPTLAQQFADLKSGLKYVQPDDWAIIPDIGDSSVKKEKFTKFTPAPDSLLDSARQDSSYAASDQTASTSATTDLAALGAGRTSVLGHNLDAAASSTSASVAVDRNGYLAALTSGNNPATSAAIAPDIGDVNKARQLLRTVTATNPSHAPGWIAAARLEETAGKLSVARKLILDGCRAVPRDEEVWLEAARLHPPEVARRLFARAARTVPRSERIWLGAAAIEGNNSVLRRRIVRRALEILPSSAALWRAAVELEPPAAARLLLTRAVECASNDAKLWIALARLEPYDNAKDVLRRARIALPKEPQLVVAQALLDEAHHGAEADTIRCILREGMFQISKMDKKHDGNDHEKSKLRLWFKEAEEAEKSGHVGTASALVQNAIRLDVTEDISELAKRCSMYASQFEKDSNIAMARAALGLLTETKPDDMNAWREAIDLERRKGNDDSVKTVISLAVKNCPRARELWSLLARDIARGAGGLQAARNLFGAALQTNGKSEAVWLAAAEFELKFGNVGQARELLDKARQKIEDPRVWVRSALVERHAGDQEAQDRLLREGVGKFPQNEKLWLMLAQLLERERQGKEGDESENEIRRLYGKGIDKSGGKWAPLWIGLARVEERTGSQSRARAVLERGREKCASTELSSERALLWREAALLEVRGGDVEAGRATLARALRDCKGSGVLWAASVGLETRRGQKMRSVEAIKACSGDARVMLEVGKFIWRSGKLEKARTWIRRAVEADPRYGDAWAALIALEREAAEIASGTENMNSVVAGVEREAVAAEPKDGDLWESVMHSPGNEKMDVVDILRAVVDLVSSGTVGKSLE